METILEATARVLVSRGWAGTTTNHVAAKAGVSVGTLYEYFPSKEALVTALVSRHLDEAEQRLSNLAGTLIEQTPTLESLVSSIVEAMIDLHAATPKLHRVLFEEVPHTQAVRSRVKELERVHATALAMLLPQLAPVNQPELVAQVIVELLEALTHRWVITPSAEPLPRPQMQAELERLVISYVRSSSQRVSKAVD